MKISILGGTGKLGLGLAARLASTTHDVMIASRDAARASQAASALNERIQSGTNSDGAAWCDIAILSIPYSNHRALLEPLRNQLRTKLIIDATVPLNPDNIFQIKTESGQSSAEETAAITQNARVFAAFQTISYRILRQPNAQQDVLIAGPGESKPDVIELIRVMALRPIDAGNLEVARHLEHMTALLLSINKANKVKEAGIKITGV